MQARAGHLRVRDAVSLEQKKELIWRNVGLGSWGKATGGLVMAFVVGCFPGGVGLTEADHGRTG